MCQPQQLAVSLLSTFEAGGWHDPLSLGVQISKRRALFNREGEVE